MAKILGVGWAKTGTTSLGLALEALGYRHKGQAFDLVDDLQIDDEAAIREIAERHDSFDDWPWLLLYREFDRWYPGSRFILTIREAQDWLRSYYLQLERAPAGEEWNRRRRILYGLPFPDVTDGMLVERYLRHNEEVRDYFRGRPNDLLVVDWSKGDGWEQLCAFLGKDVPDLPFLHANAAKPMKRSPLRGLVRGLAWRQS